MILGRQLTSMKVETATILKEVLNTFFLQTDPRTGCSNVVNLLDLICLSLQNPKTAHPFYIKSEALALPPPPPPIKPLLLGWIWLKSSSGSFSLGLGAGPSPLVFGPGPPFFFGGGLREASGELVFRLRLCAGPALPLRGAGERASDAFRRLGGDRERDGDRDREE